MERFEGVHTVGGKQNGIPAMANTIKVSQKI